MFVLPHKETVRWFQAEGYQPPLVVSGDWNLLEAEILAALAPKDRYVLASDKRSIAIEEVRKMVNATVSTTPFGRRLIVIPHAERLSLPAAQALLKFLEEPTAGNRVLLVTKFPKRLLPTIRSRVQISRTANSGKEPVSTSDVVTGVDAGRLLTSKNRRALTEEELEEMGVVIDQALRRGGKQADTYRALLRLRDYYKIRSAGGNEKLAADVLLASLIELGSTQKNPN